MRSYNCSDYLTVHDLAAGLYATGDSSFSPSGPPSLRKRNPVSGRPCTTIIGWYRNQWGALLGILEVKANCELFNDMVFGTCQNHLPRLRPLPLVHYPSLPSICCEYLPLFPVCIAGYVLVEGMDTELLRFYHIYTRGSRGEFLETRYLYLRVRYVSRQCGPRLKPVPSCPDQPSRTGHFYQVCANRL